MLFRSGAVRAAAVCGEISCGDGGGAGLARLVGGAGLCDAVGLCLLAEFWVREGFHLKRRHFMAGFAVIGLLFAATIGAVLSPPDDWENEDLPGVYEIWRVNADTIALVEPLGEFLGRNVVESYVFRVAYNDEYIFAQQAASRAAAQEGEAAYYIVVVASGAVSGGYTRAEFEAHAVVTGLEEFPAWQDATKKP